MNINLKDLNNLIVEKIDSGDPFSVLRIDNTFGYVSQSLFHNRQPSNQFFNSVSLALEAGIFPTTLEYYNEYVRYMNEKAMRDCDILGFADMSLEICEDHEYTKQFGNKPMFFGHENLMIMDPIGLLRGGHLTKQDLDTIWLSKLAGKKVVVISTHVETICKQWENIDKIWGDLKSKIAPYDLVGVIRSPYHPGIDNRQYPNCNAWHESVEYIKKQIDTIDYDVLLAGCTTSASIYAEHAKQRGKIGIQTGGVLQLHYGILGYRWASVEGYKDWHNYYNENWIYPLNEDKPNNYNPEFNLESHIAYW